MSQTGVSGDQPPAGAVVREASNGQQPSYIIPLRFRKMENLHIVFWIFKDISWCMVWRPLGICMILPTLLISVFIAWRTRKLMSELCHNVAVCVWIAANSYWMIAEFLGFDEKIIYGSITYRHLTLIPFGIGVLALAYYYLYWKPLHKNRPETM